MDPVDAFETCLQQVGQGLMRRIFKNQNDVQDGNSNEKAEESAEQCPPTDRCEDSGTPPESPHQQDPAHSPQQTPVETPSASDASKLSGGEQHLPSSPEQGEIDNAIEEQDNSRVQAASDNVQHPNVLTTGENQDNLQEHSMDFQQNGTAVRTFPDVLPDVSSEMPDTTTTDEKSDLGLDIQSKKDTGELQSLPITADEASEGNRNVRASNPEQEDSSDAAGCKQLDPPLPLPPGPSSDTGHACSTSGDDQGVRTDRSLATDKMEAGQEAEASEDLVQSPTHHSETSVTVSASTEESDFYKGRPSFAARVDSLPFSNQEHNIIKHLHGLAKVISPSIIVGDEGCGKTTAMLMLARHMLAAGEIRTVYWYDSDHVSRCWFPNTNTYSLLVIDDFLGHCPSESVIRLKSVRRFFSSVPYTKVPIIMTSRTSMIQQIQASCGADFSSMFCETQFIPLSMDYKQLWRSTMTGIKIKTPTFDRLPSIGFPLCCRLLPCLSQSLQKILFKQPRYTLRKAIIELMKAKNEARTALALLAVTDGYLDTSVLIDPAKVQASQYWKLLNSLEEEPVDKSTATAVVSFYKDCGGLILIEDEFASFVNEAVRESVLVVLCESHAEFLSEFCSLKLLSQIALVTSDVKDDSDEVEKPVIPDCAKSAFLRRIIAELESRNYQGVFTCNLLTHASFQEKLVQEINQDLMTTLLDTRDQNGLHFLFHAGATGSVFKHALFQLDKTDKRMVLQALLACCYWDHAKDIDPLWARYKDKKRLKKSLKTATIEQILTGDLPGFSFEKAPLWSDVPIHPEDTLVTMAAWRGNDTVVQNLASKGMNLSSQGVIGLTALMHYCSRGNSNMTSFLLEKKADPLTADVVGMTALMFALNRKEWEIPQELFNFENCKGKNQSNDSPLTLACANGWSVRTIKNILSRGASVISKDNCGMNCLHNACLYGHSKITEYLLKNTNIDVGEKTDGGFSPLILALTHPDQLQLVKILLNAQHPQQLELALIVQFISKYSGKRILEQVFSVCHPDNTMIGFALLTACEIGNLDIVRYLLHQGINPRLLGETESSTCLHLTCSGLSLETVEMLAKEMDCNIKTSSGTTPIMTALQHGRLEFAQLLHRRGASLDMKDDIGGCLHHAVKSDSIRVLEWCVNEHQMDVNERNGKNQTPLFLASSEGRTRSMKWLLDHQADVTATDKDGNSCLHAAAQPGCLGALEILLSKMCPGELKVPNNSGKTPVQLARESGHNHVVNYLGDFDLADSGREKGST